MPKARKPTAKPEPASMPQVGDKVIPERSEFTWVITHVSSDGNEVNLNLPGTNLDRYRVSAEKLKFVDRKSPPRTSNPFTSAEPVLDGAQALERIRVVQSENLQRLDDDIAILTKYLKTEGASKSVLETMETLSNEQHASWQAAIERIEKLINS
jgi:hypothetical protein